LSQLRFKCRREYSEEMNRLAFVINTFSPVFYRLLRNVLPMPRPDWLARHSRA
jgi:hypothetical protein